MIRVIVILTILFATPARANMTQRDMRQIAYDGDFAQMEATFAILHQQSLDGEISYDELRHSVSALTVSHPDILDFTHHW